MPEAPSPGLIPRKYQEEIFSQAQHGNIIAALGTGSGKTLISALLVKWIALKESYRSKVVIFLVPKVALVEQQGSFLSAHTPLRVCKLHGSLDIDLTDRAGWQTRFEQHDVFVMTAQIFLNFLTHSVWGIDRTSLIIFDECHHARKKHPYSQIMNGFYFHAPTATRPKIFGMTASPIWDPNDAAETLASLEKNLDAKVVGVRQHSAELDLHVPRPSEVIEIFPPPPESLERDSYLYRALSSFAHLFVDNNDMEWTKIQTRYLSALYNLGSYCAELFLFYEMDHRVSQVIRQAAPAGLDVDDDPEDFITLPGLLARVKPLHPEMVHVQEVLAEYRQFFHHDKTSDVLNRYISLQQCTPKVNKLISILLAHNTSIKRLETPPTGSMLVPTPSSLAPFQTIIFVEQRHTASCLAHILPHIAELGGMFKSGVLLGEGIGTDNAPRSIISAMGGGASASGREETLNMFRKGEINILVATSVAEEGLDFPACSLIIRFDPLQHLVAYVQSRGRARNKTASKFVIMLPADNKVELDKYQKFLRGEPEVKKLLEAKLMHQANQQDAVQEDDADEDDDEETDAIYELNLKDRERHVVPETGATLNYDNAINLLGHLCALIPCDTFTPTHAPKYAVSVTRNDTHTLPSSTTSAPSATLGGYSCALRLPASLPLPPSHLSFVGPVKLSKKEAKRAVAFQAVKVLREYDVFDEWLLPTSGGTSKRGRKSIKGKTDIDGRGYADVSTVKPLMEVEVRNPWFSGPNTRDLGLASGDEDAALWLHAVWIDGRRMAGVIADTSLPPSDFQTDEGHSVKLTRGRKLDIRQSYDLPENPSVIRDWMSEFTLKGIWYRVTASLAEGPPSFYVVPLVADAAYPRVDFEALRKFAGCPNGSCDWDSITPEQYDRVPVVNHNQYGRMYLLRRVRHDLTPQSTPPEGSRESNASTYYDYWIEHWTRKRWKAIVTKDCPLIEVTRLARHPNASYDVHRRLQKPPKHQAFDGALLPQGACNWIDLSPNVLRAFEIIPQLARRITDVYRVASARLDTGLPAIQPDLLLEAFTIPSTDAPYNNQRLETLGDSVLKVCVTIHAFNKFPYRHEGQLTILRQWTISNWCLLSRAKEIGLEHYLISESSRNLSWPHFQTKGQDIGRTAKRVTREFPRRSLQDCMEATLGAAFLTGGMPMVLHTGDALGLSFGGSIPWSLRYGRQTHVQQYIPSLFTGIQETIGYSFKRADLLVEAMTHPSFASESGGHSYQRLEFLGDAILDLVVVHYLYRKFPEATSHQLSFPRTRAICSQALAWVGVNKLQLHKTMLINNIELTSAIMLYVPLLEECTAEGIVKRGWRYDPPKVISDVVESLLGALLIDCGWDYEKTAVITELLMEEVLEQLSPSLQYYPAVELIQWVAMSGCTKLKWEKSESKKGQCMTVLIHGTVIAGPITSPSLMLAKHAVAERALAHLREPDGEKSLLKMCTCKEERIQVILDLPQKDDIDSDEEAEQAEVEALLLVDT